MTAALTFETAGTTVALLDRTNRHAGPLARAAGVSDDQPTDSSHAEVRVLVERERHPFDTSGMRAVTRGVWWGNDTVVVDSVGRSGFTQAWRLTDGHVEIRTRWSASLLERGASVLRSRFDALRAQVLVHHPALWWAGTRGLAPLHVSVLDIDDVVVMLAGPGGVGKSTLVAQALSRGARATCDNVAVCDGELAFGLREPLRLAVADGGPATGARTTHGRREMSWSGHVGSMRPGLLVVLRRGDGPRVRTIRPADAHRALVAGTYAAGELSRFWSLTAVVGLATGRGPVQPSVDDVARRFSTRLPCLELELGASPGEGLHTLLAPHLDQARRTQASS